MIRLYRSDPPPSIDTPEKEQEQGQHFDRHRSTSPWRASDILERLFRDANKKCAYCESLLGAADDMQVDHFIPKDEVPLLAATWTNLNCSCGRCNQLKSVGLRYVNPYMQEPSEHFFYSGSRLHAITEEGRTTLKRLRLNERMGEGHHTIWRAVQELISNLHDKLARAQAAPLKGILQVDIWSEAASILESGTYIKEYSAVVASHLVQYTEWERAERLLRQLGIWDDELQQLSYNMQSQALPDRRPE